VNILHPRSRIVVAVLALFALLGSIAPRTTNAFYGETTERESRSRLPDLAPPVYAGQRDCTTTNGSVSVALVIDTSGSMSRPQDKIEDAKEAAISFVGNLRGGDEVAVVTFNVGGTLVVERTPTDSDEQRASIQRQIRNEVNVPPGDPGTNIQAGIDRAVDSLSNSIADNGKFIILLSD
jgi:Mg-chelatase subunit ChlD